MSLTSSCMGSSVSIWSTPVNARHSRASPSAGRDDRVGSDSTSACCICISRHLDEDGQSNQRAAAAICCWPPSCASRIACCGLAPYDVGPKTEFSQKRILLMSSKSWNKRRTDKPWWKSSKQPVKKQSWFITLISISVSKTISMSRSGQKHCCRSES